MSGVWMFEQNGVIRLVDHPSSGRQAMMGSGKRKVLVHLPTGEVISGYTMLEPILKGLGWERYYGGENSFEFMQFHRKGSIDLISLPKEFPKFNSIYMYDLVIKNPNTFQVRDVRD
uniref:Uncharacterized protein n=1 Tax=Kalanchoe fedtschenkoi TaxID=63787 RepID=A0A7N0U8B4_KALFE